MNGWRNMYGAFVSLIVCPCAPCYVFVPIQTVYQKIQQLNKTKFVLTISLAAVNRKIRKRFVPEKNLHQFSMAPLEADAEFISACCRGEG